MTQGVDGALFGMWFFAKLKRSGLTFLRTSSSSDIFRTKIEEMEYEPCTSHLMNSQVLTFDPEGDTPEVDLEKGGMWLQPKKSEP